MRTRNGIRLVLAALTVVAMSCGSDDNSTSPTNTLDLVGTWEMTSVAGVAQPLGTSSWLFRADGTYFWQLPQFELDGGGNWSISGTTLTVDGEIQDLLDGQSTLELTVGGNGSTFSFVTTENETWVYEKQ